MTREEVELAATLSELTETSLPAEVAARVHAIARAELAPVDAPRGRPLGLVLGGAVVPTMLVTAAAVRTTVTVDVAGKIYSENE